MYQNLLTIYQISLKFVSEWEKFITIFHCQFKIIFSNCLYYFHIKKIMPMIMILGYSLGFIVIMIKKIF